MTEIEREGMMTSADWLRACLAWLDDSKMRPQVIEHIEAAAEDLDDYLSAAPAPVAVAEGARRVRHKKRGTTYQVIGEAEAQIARPLATFQDGTQGLCLREGDKFLTIYQSEDDGKLYLRRSAEFEDGRFEDIAAPTPPAQGVEASSDAIDKIARYICETITLTDFDSLRADGRARDQGYEPWRVVGNRNARQEDYRDVARECIRLATPPVAPAQGVGDQEPVGYRIRPINASSDAPWSWLAWSEKEFEWAQQHYAAEKLYAHPPTPPVADQAGMVEALRLGRDYISDELADAEVKLGSVLRYPGERGKAQHWVDTVKADLAKVDAALSSAPKAAEQPGSESANGIGLRIASKYVVGHPGLRLAKEIADAIAAERSALSTTPKPVDWQHIANEWADAATSGHVWIQNIRDGVSTPRDALANLDTLFARIRALANGGK